MTGGFVVITLYIFSFLCSNIKDYKGSVCLDYFIVWEIVRKVDPIAFSVVFFLVTFIVQNRFHRDILTYVHKYFDCVNCPLAKSRFVIL